MISRATTFLLAECQPKQVSMRMGKLDGYMHSGSHPIGCSDKQVEFRLASYKMTHHQAADALHNTQNIDLSATNKVLHIYERP